MDDWDKKRRWSAKTQCSCGQEEKVIVFVGCTQHGKSSLVRSILRYGGYPDSNDYIGVGSGNRSETKTPKTFSLVLDIGEHGLKDEDGYTRGFELRDGDDPDDILSLDVLPSKSTGEHVHLKLVDTPGLDDSENAAFSTLFPLGRTTGEPTRVLDQRYKAAILKAVALEGRIHAVCYVLSIHQTTLSPSTKRLLQEYMNIFQFSGLDRSIHFAHTMLNTSILYENKAQERGRVLRDAFPSLKGSLHHLTDSEPLLGKDDTTSQVFSLWATSQLLTHFAQDQSQPVDALRFPKSAAHRVMDYAIENAVTAEQELCASEIAAFHTEKADLEADIARLNRREASEWSSFRDLQSRFEETNSEEMVLIDQPHERFERGHFWSRSSIYIHVQTPVTIRRVDCTKGNPLKSTWDIRGDPVGTTSFSAYLRGTESSEAISGTVRLYGWKKEVEKTELETRENDMNSARNDWSSTYTKVNEKKSEIERCDLAVREAEGKSMALGDLLEPVQRQDIPMDIIRARGNYLASSSSLAYCYALGLEHKIPRERLDQWEEFSKHGEVDEMMAERLEAMEVLLEISKQALERIDQDVRRKSVLIQRLKDLNMHLADWVKDNLTDYVYPDDLESSLDKNSTIQWLRSRHTNKTESTLRPFQDNLISRGNDALEFNDELVAPQDP